MKKTGINVSIRGKLFIGFGVIILIIIFSGLREYDLLKKFDSKRISSAKSGELTSILNQSKLIISSEKTSAANIAAAQSEKSLDRAKEIHFANAGEIDRIFERASKIVNSDREDYLKIHNQIISDSISITSNIYKNELQKAFDKLIENCVQILDTGFFLKNVTISPTDIVTDSLNQEDNSKNRQAQLQKIRFDISSRVEFINFQSETLNKKIANTIEESLKRQIVIDEQTEILYDKEAGTNTLILIIAISFAIAIVLLISRSVLYPIRRIEYQLQLLKKGVLPENLGANTSDEIGRISKLLDQHVERLRETAKFSGEIGKANFTSEFNILGKEDVLGNALVTMQGSLKNAIEEENKRKVEDSQRSRTSEGLALFADILRKYTKDITELSNQIVSNLVKFLNANQGGIFILNDNNPDDIYYDLLGAYAYNRVKFLDKQVRPGEGLVGSVAVEKYTIYMTDVPQEYIEIESGIGSANPNSILIVPLKIEDNVLGIIELASFNIFAKYEIELVEKIAESIAATLSTARINSKTAELLEQSKLTTAKMHRQEEEMLQNIEELKITQDESNRREQKLRESLKEIESAHKKLADKEERQEQKLKELHGLNSRLQKTIDEKDEYNKNILESNQNGVIVFNEHFEIEFFNGPAQKIWKYKETEMIGKTIAFLFPENVVKQYSDDKLNAYDIFESGLLTIGAEKNVLSKTGQTVPVRFSLSESEISGKKKYTAFAVDIRKEKEKDKKIHDEIEETIGKEIDYEIRIEKLEKLMSDHKIQIPDIETDKELIEWSDAYSIDLRVIDQQHKKWIDIVNKLYSSFKDKREYKELIQIFTEFADYTDYHFSFEEKYMIDFKYPDFKNHKRQHVKLLMEITKLKKSLQEDHNHVIGYSLMKLLRNWVSAHIQQEDIKYVELFKQEGLS